MRKYLRKFRRLNRLYAYIYGYFWLPCPICKEPFGGHEWIGGHHLATSANGGKGVCYKEGCRQEATCLNEYNEGSFKPRYQTVKGVRDLVKVKGQAAQ